MSRHPLVRGGLLGGVLSAPLAATWFAVSVASGLPFPPFVVFEAITRLLPGWLVTGGIEVMVRVLTAMGLSVRAASKPAEQLLATAGFVAASVVGAAVMAAVLRRGRRWLLVGLVAGTVLGLPALVFLAAGIAPAGVPRVVAAAWCLALPVAWALSTSWALRSLAPGWPGDREAVPTSRRDFLIRLASASASVTVIGAVVGTTLARRMRQPAIAPAGPPARPNALDPAPGTRPEYTPLPDHYRIDINLMPPVIAAATWRLEVGGLVEQPLELTLDDFENERWGEVREEFITLACISNELGGDLIGTTRWRGVSLQRVLAEARPRPEAGFLLVRSVDDFFETVPLDLVRSDERIMLTYRWDGVPLPAEHGFPLRIYIPDRYGMKQPKWITSIEAVADDRSGYWVERGWSREARMKATSVIDSVAVDATYEQDGARFVPIGGIAHAGARGISEVEVQVDGEEWKRAILREPLSALTWVLWRFDWPFSPGRHTFAVRCRDGEGRLQISEPSPPHPSGATGISSITRTIG